MAMLSMSLNFSGFMCVLQHSFIKKITVKCDTRVCQVLGVSFISCMLTAISFYGKLV